MKIKIMRNNTEEIREILAEEENPIEIKTIGGKLRFVGFAKYVENGRVVFAFKIKHSQKKILIYENEKLDEMEKKKLDIFLNYAKKNYADYEICDILKEEVKKKSVLPAYLTSFCGFFFGE